LPSRVTGSPSRCGRSGSLVLMGGRRCELGKEMSRGTAQTPWCSFPAAYSQGPRAVAHERIGRAEHLRQGDRRAVRRTDREGRRACRNGS
jgi:hypothetical protein